VGDEFLRGLAYRCGVSTVAVDRAARWRFIALAGPLALGVLQVLGTFGASQHQSDRRSVDALAIVLVLAGALSLLWLRRYPVQVLWFVSALTLVYLLRGYAYGPVILSPVVALVVNVIRGHRLAAWLAAAFIYFGHFALRPFFSDQAWSWGQALGVAAWTLVILIAAEVTRVRRERAVTIGEARAETERRQANEERLRIARELHDVVAHHMSLINVQAGVALHLVDRRPEQAQTALVAIKDASKEALVELRALVGVLRDETEVAPRAPVPMLASLDGLIERSGHAGLTVRKATDGDVRALPAAVELAAFRIVQEAITNVVRHAGATHADIRLSCGAAELRVQVDDDGTGGARLGSLREGSGIRGMRERAVALGGTLTISAAASGGTRVSAVLPLDGAS
jgi:signal transduction histidine kinase